MRYELIIYWSKAYCAAYKEAVANAQLVVQEWIAIAKSLERPSVAWDMPIF